MSCLRHVSPIYFLLGVVIVVTIIRWAGIGDPHVLTIVNLILLSVMGVWGTWLDRRKRRPPHRSPQGRGSAP